MLIDHAELHRIALRVFEAAGSQPDEAQLIADHLIEANLRGHDSHGVGLIPNYLQHLANGTVFANRKGRVVSEDGSLIVYDGERAYALAFVCEMLAGALCGSGTMRPERQGRGTATNGMLTIVIDPSRLIDREWLRNEIAAMTDYITASPPARPDEPVLIPGDPERRTKAERLAL